MVEDCQWKSHVSGLRKKEKKTSKNQEIGKMMERPGKLQKKVVTKKEKTRKTVKSNERRVKIEERKRREACE